MVGGGKPNRSEDLGTLEEQEQNAQQVRAYLDANAPRRQLKPARSDAADRIAQIESDNNTNPPEHKKFLQLLTNGVPLETLSTGAVSEDYTESEYYQYMAAIDKAHHTTGSGFIKVDKPPEGFHLSTDSQSGGFQGHHSCNPAMNDWEPAPNSSDNVSNKPSRSESS